MDGHGNHNELGAIEDNTEAHFVDSVHTLPAVVANNNEFTSPSETQEREEPATEAHFVNSVQTLPSVAANNTDNSTSGTQERDAPVTDAFNKWDEARRLFYEHLSQARSKGSLTTFDDETYDYHVNILRSWKDGDKHSSHDHYIKSKFTLDDSTPARPLRRLGLIVPKNDEIFTIIKEGHEKEGHSKSRRGVYNFLKHNMRYCMITEVMIKLYMDLCPHHIFKKRASSRPSLSRGGGGSFNYNKGTTDNSASAAQNPSVMMSKPATDNNNHHNHHWQPPPATAEATTVIESTALLLNIQNQIMELYKQQGLPEQIRDEFVADLMHRYNKLKNDQLVVNVVTAGSSTVTTNGNNNRKRMRIEQGEETDAAIALSPTHHHV